MNDETIRVLTRDIKMLFQKTFFADFAKEKNNFIRKWTNLSFTYMRNPVGDIYQPKLYFNNRKQLKGVLLTEKDLAIKNQDFKLAHILSTKLNEEDIETVIDIFKISFEIQYINGKITIVYNTNSMLFYEVVMRM
jgi:hypothetical protein